MELYCLPDLIYVPTEAIIYRKSGGYELTVSSHSKVDNALKLCTARVFGPIFCKKNAKKCDPTPKNKSLRCEESIHDTYTYAAMHISSPYHQN